MNKKVLGVSIRQRRKEITMTTTTLAELAEVKQSTIQQIEKGYNLPSLSVFIKICIALRTSPNYFLMDEFYSIPDKLIDAPIQKLSPSMRNAAKEIIDILSKY